MFNWTEDETQNELQELHIVSHFIYTEENMYSKFEVYSVAHLIVQ